MYRKILLVWICSWLAGFIGSVSAQIDVEHVISIGRNALYFNDYVVSIGYFNRVIDTRPWLAEPYLYRSIAKISLDDYRGAATDATACIVNNPYISRAYLVRGVAYQHLERYDEAIQDYKQGIRLSPDNGQMRFNLAVAQLKQKQYADAERSIDSLLKYNPQHAEAYALRANIALERRDTTLALMRTAEALRIDPNISMPYRIEAAIAGARSNWYEGIRALSQAIEIEGARPELYTDRAIMYYQVNNLKGALADYTEALRLNPQNKIALNNRAVLYQQVGEKRLALEDWGRIISLEEHDYIARYNRALLLSDLGQNLSLAIADLDKVLAHYPSFVDGFLQRALLKRRLGNSKGASDDYWHANNLLRNKQLNQQALATARNNQKRATKTEQDQSIDKYSMLIEGKSENIPDARYKSQVRGRVQDRDVEVESQAMYYLSYFSPASDEKHTRQQAYYSVFVEPYNHKGDSLLLRLQARPMALDSLQIQQLEALLSMPKGQDEVHYYLRRGIAHSLLQDYDQAILDYNRVLASDGRNLLALFARSVASMRQSEVRRMNAQESSRRQTPQSIVGDNSTQPTSSTAGQRLGLELVPSAMQDLAQLLMLSPDFAYGYYNRAILYGLRGERAAAIVDYSKAIELQPRLAEAYYNRALLYLAEGRTSEGINDLSKAGELGLYEAYNLIKRMR